MLGSIEAHRLVVVRDRDQPQPVVWCHKATQPVFRVLIDVTDSYREVQCGPAVIDAAPTKNCGTGHLLADDYPNRVQVRVGRPQPASMGHRDRQHISDTADERDLTAISSADSRIDRRRDVDPPMAPIPPDRRETSQHLPGNRFGQAGARTSRYEKRHDQRERRGENPNMVCLPSHRPHQQRTSSRRRKEPAWSRPIYAGDASVRRGPARSTASERSSSLRNGFTSAASAPSFFASVWASS